jgi:hypothetical protein
MVSLTAHHAYYVNVLCQLLHVKADQASHYTRLPARSQHWMQFASLHCALPVGLDQALCGTQAPG